jgi:Tfp pilus assembly protein PilF
MGKASRKKEQNVQVSSRETPAPFLTGSLTRTWTVLLLLSLLSIFIYSNTFSASFHFDDIGNIVKNPRIKNVSNLLDFSESRYVGFLSFALNYDFGQLDVFGYHLVNVLIHITNGFLVYALILILFKTPRMQSSSFSPDRSFGIALATALLFVAHPIQTQAVTYITQRFTSLATLFYLLGVVLYLKWRLTPSETRDRPLWYTGALFSTVLAMKTKEITFTLPFMLLLVEALFFGSFTRKRWMALIPFLLALPIIPLSHLPGAMSEGEDVLARETTAISRVDYLFTQFRVVMTYLRLLVLPVDQNLDYDYSISHSLLEPQVLFSFLFLSAFLGLALYLLFLWPRAFRHSPFTMSASRLTAFGILWFFLTLSIESSIIPIRDVIFEHRLYLPSVGFWLAGSVAVLGLLDRWRMNAIAIGVVVAILSVATYERNLIWNNDLTLWGDVIQKSPNKARGHVMVGDAYQNLGRIDEAIQEYKTTLTLKPNSAEVHSNQVIDYTAVHNNLGTVYQKLGRQEEAIQEYKTALTLKPNSAEIHYNLGAVYRKTGRIEEAIQEYETAITLNPDYAEAHNNLGNGYESLGRADKAIQEFKTALTLKPNYARAHFNLGIAYQKLGRLEKAIHEFEQALQLEPDFEPARQALKSLRQ